MKENNSNVLETVYAWKSIDEQEADQEKPGQSCEGMFEISRFDLEWRKDNGKKQEIMSQICL